MSNKRFAALPLDNLRISFLPKRSFHILAVSNERIKMMSLLASGPRSAASVSSSLEIPISAVYRHAKALQTAGWIKKLKTSELKMLSMLNGDESGRAYYVPAAVIYVSYVADGCFIKVLSDYVALVNFRFGCFLLKVDGRKVCSCGSCSYVDLCCRWFDGIARAYQISSDQDDVGDRILDICFNIASKELVRYLMHNPITITSHRLLSICGRALFVLDKISHNDRSRRSRNC